jgi:Spy/CpxP family protein refolding chaperone
MTQAQNAMNNPKLQERISDAKLKEIQRGLNISDDQLKELSPIYKRYESELNDLMTANQGRQFQRHPDSLSTVEADQMISTKLDNAVKISTIRRKYYPEFKSVLTPQQVMKLYQSEIKLRKKVMQEFRRRFGNRQR